MRSVPSTTIISFQDDPLGYVVFGSIEAIGSGIPTTASTFAVGCRITDKSTGYVYFNTGTVASPVWTRFGGTALMDPRTVQIAEVAIASGAITGTSAGQLGHANGVALVAAQGSGTVIELISVVMSFTYATAAYTGGGNVTVNWGGGGAAITGLVSAANSLGASADKVVQFVPLAAAGNAMSANTGINLVAASAFTQPGTAAGTVKCFVTYRVHTL